MTEKLRVRPLGLPARIADVLMIPIMYIVSGTTEKPQRTHRWNNTKLAACDVEYLNLTDMVHCLGISDAGCRFRWHIPAFHTPIFGGWRDYVVLKPYEKEVEWHVGWIADDVVGVSRIKLRGPVRTLLGPGDGLFFGINARGVQVPIYLIGTGSIGKHNLHEQVPLL